jgi:putative SOS response-associated peptidase YedK
VHNRIPVILYQEDYPSWLGEMSVTAEELQELLKPFPAVCMLAHEIGPRIGNVKYDEVALIEASPI